MYPNQRHLWGKNHFTHPVIKRKRIEQRSLSNSPQAKWKTSKPSVNLSVGHILEKATIFCLVETRQVLESEKPKFEFGSVVICEKCL